MISYNEKEVVSLSGIDKIIDKMKRQPRGISYAEIVKVLVYHGYILVRTRGSHRYFRNDAGDLIMIKQKNPIKISYINEVLERIGE